MWLQYSPQLGYYNPYYSTYPADMTYATYPQQPTDDAYLSPQALQQFQQTQTQQPPQHQTLQPPQHQTLQPPQHQTLQLPDPDPRLQTYNAIPTLPFPGYKSPFGPPPASLGYNEAVPTMSIVSKSKRPKTPLIRQTRDQSENSAGCGRTCQKRNSMYIATIIIAVLTIAIIIVVAVLARGRHITSLLIEYHAYGCYMDMLFDIRVLYMYS